MQTTNVSSRNKTTNHAPGLHPAGRDGKFLTTVNDVELLFVDPMPRGRHILGEAGFTPVGDHVLIQLVVHGTRSVGLDEPVDLRQKGVEAFRAFKSDRVFLFTVDDRGFEWGEAKITEPDLRRVAGVGDNEIIVLERDGKDIELYADDIVELGGSGTEHLRIVKEFVTVSLDRVEKKIPGGTYTTEKLIRVLEVQAGYVLDLVNAQGKLMPLTPGETISLEAGMKFFSHVPTGGSS